MAEYSEQFDKERKYRVEVSYFKYGPARKNFASGRVDALAAINAIDMGNILFTELSFSDENNNGHINTEEEIK